MKDIAIASTLAVSSSTVSVYLRGCLVERTADVLDARTRQGQIRSSIINIILRERCPESNSCEFTKGAHADARTVIKSIVIAFRLASSVETHASVWIGNPVVTQP